MPRNRKLFINNTTLFVSTRAEEGLPFWPSLYMNFILWGILARARKMYEVKICHFIFMANHLHMLLVVDNPAHIDKFMQYVKRESAHAVNKLWGRRKRTVWCDGYDSPVVLTAEDVMRYIVYIYTNPLDSKHPRTISQFKGVSSWRMFQRTENNKLCKWIRRSAIPKLPSGKIAKGLQISIHRFLTKNAGGSTEFILEPNAWMKCFAELSKKAPEELNSEICKTIKKTEAKALKNNPSQPQNDTVPAIAVLTRYLPTKRSPRMLCLSSDKELRKLYITWYRSMAALASIAYQAFIRGSSFAYPPGFFSPGGTLQINLNPAFLLN